MDRSKEKGHSASCTVAFEFTEVRSGPATEDYLFYQVGSWHLFSVRVQSGQAKETVMTRSDIGNINSTVLNGGSAIGRVYSAAHELTMS